MWGVQCNVEFEYLLSICSGTKEKHGKPWSGWLVAGPSGCIQTSSQQPGTKYASPNISSKLKLKLYCDRQSVGQFVLLSGPDFKLLCLTITLLPLFVRRPFWREDGSATCSEITHWLGQSPYFIPRNRVVQLCPPGTGFPFHRLLRLAGLRRRYSNPPPQGTLRQAKSS
jgi:hypothetical protein